MELDLERLKIPEERKRGRSPRWLLLGAILLGLAAFVLVLLFLPARNEAKSVALYRIPSAASELPVLTVGGYVQPERRVTLSSRYQETIQEIPVEEGRRVKRGDVLALLGNRELLFREREISNEARATQAKGQQLDAALLRERVQQRQNEVKARESVLVAEVEVRQQRLRFREKEVDLERKKRLFEKQVIALKELQDAQQAFDLASQELQASQNRLEMQKASLTAALAGRQMILQREKERNEAYFQHQATLSKLASIRQQLGQTILRSPFDGIVLEKYMQVGEMASPTLPILTVADTRDYYVEADVTEADLPRLSAATHAMITLDAYPGKTFRGAMKSVAPMVNRQKGTVRVKVKLLEKADFLRPELTAKVEFYRKGGGANVLTIPSSAVARKGEKTFVFIFQDGRAVIREVSVAGENESGSLEVRQGLSPGDVIIRDAHGLSDRQRVKVGE